MPVWAESFKTDRAVIKGLPGAKVSCILYEQVFGKAAKRFF
jgi:hypothetical protein